MIKLNKIHFIAFITLAAVAVLIYLFVYPSLRIKYLEREADVVIHRIESFHKQHSRLPASLAELGLADNYSWLHYQMISAKDYELSFDTGMYWQQNTYSSAHQGWYIHE